MTTKPCPARFYWLKRLTLAGLVLVILLVALRLFWGHRMQSRLDEAIADIQAKGEPILFEDLQIAELPDPENAAWHLMQALQNWPSVPGQPGLTIHDTDWYLEGEEAGHTDPITDNAAYLATCKPVLDSIRKAVAMDQARWFSGPMPTDYNSFINTFNHQVQARQLARLMEDASRRAFKNGDLALGLEILHLIGQHGDRVGQQRLNSLDALIMMSIHLMAYDLTGEHLATLTDEQAREPMTRKALITLRDWLTDEAYPREVFLHSLIANRWGTHQYVLSIQDGSIPTPFWTRSGYGRLLAETPGLSYGLKPLLVKAHALALTLESESIEAFKVTDNLRDSATPGGQAFEAMYEARPWLYPMFEELFFSDAVYCTYFRQLATRRMTATAIAIKLYQADHGKRPDKLSQLVPDYLPSVPADPYVGDRAIGYKPAGVVPKTEYELGVDYSSPVSDEVLAVLPREPLPLLYSVGEDHHDNGGLLVINENNGTVQDHGFGRDEENDHWYLLVPEPEPVQALVDRYQAEFDEAFDDPFLLEGGEDEVEKQESPGDEPEDEQRDPEP